MLHSSLKGADGSLVAQPTSGPGHEYRAALVYLHYSQVIKGAQLTQALGVDRQVAGLTDYSEASGTR